MVEHGDDGQGMHQKWLLFPKFPLVIDWRLFQWTKCFQCLQSALWGWGQIWPHCHIWGQGYGRKSQYLGNMEETSAMIATSTNRKTGDRIWRSGFLSTICQLALVAVVIVCFCFFLNKSKNRDSRWQWNFIVTFLIVNYILSLINIFRFSGKNIFQSQI